MFNAIYLSLALYLFTYLHVILNSFRILSHHAFYDMHLSILLPWKSWSNFNANIITA